MVSWFNSNNTAAYGMDTNVSENVTKITFDSGRTKTFLKNTKCKKTFSFSIDMDDDGDNSEYKQFWTWYTDTLKGGALTFLFPDLITHEGDGITTGTEYRMTDTPSASGQNPKTVTIKVCEE